ncbi:MAG: tetratricopeptide repeat protein [Pirellulales bacterium]
MPQPDLDQVVVAKPGRLGPWPARLRQAIGWSNEHAILLAAVVAIMLVPVVIGAFLVYVNPPPEVEEEPAVTLEMALQAIDVGNLNEAQTLAEILANWSPKPDEAGGPVFVMGAVANARGDELLGDRQTFYYTLAASHLSQARKLGWPPGRKAEGLYLLGRSMALSGQAAGSIPVLQAALPLNPSHKAEVLRLLARGLASPDSDDQQAALPYLDELLAVDTLDAGERNQALLEKADVLFQLNDLAACQQTLEMVPGESQSGPAAALLQARISLNELRQAMPPEGPLPDEIAAGYRDTLEKLRQAEGRSPLSATAREAIYLAGVCLRALGDDAAALAQFQKVGRLHADTAEGIAGHREAASLLLASQRVEPAARAMMAALDEASPEATYRNPWLPLSVFREEALALYQRLLDRNDFNLAVELTDHLEPLFAPDQAAQLQAETHRSWSNKLLAEAERASESEAAVLRTEAAEQLQLTGQAFARLAELRYSHRDYPDQVWNSAQAFSQANDHTSAVSMFREYLYHEVRRRRPAALVGLGEALLQVGELHESQAMLQECMDRYPHDAASFRARLLASHARFEQGDVPAAEALLRANLEGEDLAPTSREWRDSLFQLGWLLHFQGRWADAIEKLEEAVERYPDSAAAVEARYLIAHSYEQNAQVSRKKYDDAAADGDRLAHGQEMQRLQRLAFDRYESALQRLLKRQESRELSALDQRLLRNAYFGKGAVLSDLGRFDEAIGVYSTVANRYNVSPASLEAYLRIAACYRRMNRPDEFRGTLERAKIILRRLPNDAAYNSVTNYSQQQWGELLDWLSSL